MIRAAWACLLLLICYCHASPAPTFTPYANSQCDLPIPYNGGEYATASVSSCQSKCGAGCVACAIVNGVCLTYFGVRPTTSTFAGSTCYIKAQSPTALPTYTSYANSYCNIAFPFTYMKYVASTPVACAALCTPSCTGFLFSQSLGHCLIFSKTIRGPGPAVAGWTCSVKN
eukprot:TRINITY_DN21997_c0_g1_i1.p1 TRINITY_DN21997_c0_g1~~TRINITY_DN21997_c0_g1_i1.p1  ORF type:complete len:171 (-),score=10.07 TRINITY_DN21997_c0_g1_i1:139-651(-)